MLATCTYCGSQKDVFPSKLKRKWGYFCSRGCYGHFRSAHPELYSVNIDAMRSTEARQKASGTRSERWRSGELKHPRKDAIISDEAKQKISRHHIESGCFKGDRNPMKKGHSEQSRAKMSETRTRLMIEGKIKAYGTGHKRGDHTSEKAGTMHYRSSWELRMMEHLDLDVTVLSYEFERVRIPYYYHGNKRWYIPDFLVTYVDGSRRMFELKPKEFVEDVKTQLKAEAGKMYCEENGILEYRLLSRGDLKDLGVL